jgi:flagellar biosynthesis protein FlhF
MKVQRQADSQEILALRSELASIKQVLTQFQKMPQTMVTQHPGAEYGIPYSLSPSYDKLVQAGLSKEIVVEMLTEAQKKMPPIRFKNSALVDGWVAKYILDTTKVADTHNPDKIQIFVGPAGGGKTSTLVKLASNYVVKDKKKVALVTTDTMKVGATDQLRIYAQILNVPFAVIRGQSDWQQVIHQLRGYDYILCDFTGMSLKTIEEIQTLKNLLPETTSKTVHLVLSAMDKDEEISEIGKRYKALNFKDVIFTGLDEALQHGSIYNFMKKFNVPLHSFGIGARVPEDYEMATRERVLDLIFKLSKMKSKDAV